MLRPPVTSPLKQHTYANTCSSGRLSFINRFGWGVIHQRPSPSILCHFLPRLHLYDVNMFIVCSQALWPMHYCIDWTQSNVPHSFDSNSNNLRWPFNFLHLLYIHSFRFIRMWLRFFSKKSFQLQNKSNELLHKWNFNRKWTSSSR